MEKRAYLAFIFLGIAGTVHGLALPFLIDAFSLTLGAAGTLFLAGSFGYLAASTTYPRIIRTTSVKPVLAWGAVIMGTANLLIPLLPIWCFVLAVALIAGFGSGVIEVGFNALVAGLPETRAKVSMNWLHFFFGVGALVGPLLLSRLLAVSQEWAFLYWVPGACFLLFSLLWLRQDSRELVAQHGREASDSGDVADLYRSTTFRLLLTAMFIYVGAEVALVGWVTTFLASEVGASRETAPLGISVLWLGLTVGRGICGRIAPHVSTRTLLLVLHIGSTAALFTLVGTNSVVAAMLLLFFVGLFFSAIFPTLMLHGTAEFPWATAQISGGLVTAAGLGALLMPVLLGFVGDIASLRAGVFLVGCSMAASAAMTYLLRPEGVTHREAIDCDS